jgi:hypothetical protein
MRPKQAEAINLI